MYRCAVVVLVLASTFTENHGSWRSISATKSKTSNTQMMVNGRSLYDCKHMICQSVDNYPEEDINKAMQHHHSLESLLKGTMFNATSDFVIANRISPFNEDISSLLCIAEGPAKYQPKAMRNLKHQWKMIVNTERYRQMFTVEACRDLSGPEAPKTRHYCSDIFGKKCKQNFQPFSLLIYENGRIEFDKFNVPTTCKCCAE